MRSSRNRVARRLIACVLSTFLFAASVPLHASAMPTGARRSGGYGVLAATTSAPQTVAAATQGPLTVSLEASAVAIPAGDPFGYTIKVSASEPVAYVQTRFQVYRPTGRLIFQRTRVENTFGPGATAYSFSRETDDLDLRPGAYPVEVTVKSTYEGETTETNLTTELLVYDPARPRVTAAIVARVSGQPLSGPNGKFLSDPARYTAARDDVDRVARLVLSDERVTLTLAVNPLLLEEWKRISLGYEIAGPEGVEQVPADAPAPQAFGATLQVLDQAITTGRLELTALGYSDPNLSELAARGLVRDVGPQYANGRSAIFSSLETTPSTGTVPAGLCVPPAAVSRLASSDVSYCVVSAACTRAKDTTAQPGAYRIADEQVVALVADDLATEALHAGDVDAVLTRLFARHVSTTRQPVTIVADLQPGADRADPFADTINALLEEPWVRIARANQVANAPRGTIRLTRNASSTQAPTGYWPAVAESRRWARALEAALGAAAPEVDTAHSNSLIAESSAWAGTDGAWLLAERGRDFADAATRSARSFLDKISVTIQPITLAGTKGEVPVSVANDNDRNVEVRLALSPEDGLRVTGPHIIDTTLRPQDNFFEIPVDLKNSLSGRLHVEVIAGEVVLDEATVTVKASYLDRLATIGGIVLLLGIMLAFIIRRVRAAESEDAHESEATAHEPDDGGVG